MGFDIVAKAGLGGSMIPDAGDYADFTNLIMWLLSTLIDAFSSVYGFLTSSVGEVLDTVLGWFPAGSLISDVLLFALKKVVIFDVRIVDVNIIGFMFGIGLVFYVFYQFVIWILNIVT